MKVFKFGGASVANAERIRNVGEIIRSYDEGLMVVISALGKTTNALENILDKAIDDPDSGKTAFEELISKHIEIANELNPDLLTEYSEFIKLIGDPVFNLLRQVTDKGYDFVYDQIVSAGELLSTNLISQYFKSEGMNTEWVDARKWIKTNKTYRDVRIQWGKTEDNIKSYIEAGNTSKVIITQGFIGSDDEGNTTTLGREGSDFTAAILGYCLDAEGVYIWKDVPGVMNADPRQFDDVTKIDFLSYRDAIEMSYYGMKVIHPKTIKPLQNKKIPLYVKSFFNPGQDGTLIKENISYSFIPPVIVIKRNQVLLNISTKDFSFIAEDNLSFIYEQFAKFRIKTNLIQNTAISLNVCFDFVQDKFDKLMGKLLPEYDITQDNPLILITLKYYNEDLIKELTKNKEIVLDERIRNTAQILVKGNT